MTPRTARTARPPPVSTRVADAETRAEVGRATRLLASRASHGEWRLAPGRPDPVGILAAQGASRVPQLLPVRYGRMASSPFAFDRGAAAIMAPDLAGSPGSGLMVQACGDAHVANFGL